MSVAQRRDGRFVVKFKDGSIWKQRAFRDEQEARAFDAAHAAPEDGRLTMGELVALFLRGRPDMNPSTRYSITWLFDDGGPCAFARDKYADTLNRQDLERFRESMRARSTPKKRISNRTINCYHAYIHAVLAWGADQSLIAFNPWRDYKRLKVQKPLITTTLNDLKRVYQCLPPYLQWAVKTAFFLALRPGLVELFNLRWSAFDWSRQLVAVRQGKSGRIKVVVLHPAYAAEARIRYAEDVKAGIPYVCHRNGVKIRSYRTAWFNACKRAGVTMRPYDIRHCAATTMLAAGADLAAVSAQMGHSSVTTTGTTYAHVTPGGQAHAAALMPLIDLSEKG